MFYLIIFFCLVSCKNKDVNTESSSESKYIWTKLSQSAEYTRYGAGCVRDGKYYQIINYTFDPLCDEDNIKTIEYFLEGCKGTFMDENKKDAYLQNVVSKPYIIEGNNQKGIYFSVYLTFDNEAELTNDKKVKEANKVLENIRVKLTVTYNDGSMKERGIAFKNTSICNYFYLDMYEITLR